MKFRKKPIVIEAIQFNGVNGKEINEWCKGTGTEREVIVFPNFLMIKTLEGDMNANKGDWIIKGIKGEFYPCKPDIFKETYEKVE